MFGKEIAEMLKLGYWRLELGPSIQSKRDLILEMDHPCILELDEIHFTWMARVRRGVIPLIPIPPGKHPGNLTS